MDEQNARDTMRAGTGFMLSPLEAMQNLVGQGYEANLVPKFDHFECKSGRERLYPDEFAVDDIVRFENSSDPDDQSILYLISSPAHGIKGLFMESYGLYHEEFSPRMIERLRRHIH